MGYEAEHTICIGQMQLSIYYCNILCLSMRCLDLLFCQYLLNSTLKSGRIYCDEDIDLKSNKSKVTCL